MLKSGPLALIELLFSEELIVAAADDFKERKAGFTIRVPESGSGVHLLFAFKNVDDFVAARAHDFNKDQQVFCCERKRFNINQLKTTKFHKLQNHVESGSGPGGRRFKSSLPDHSFSISYSSADRPTVRSRAIEGDNVHPVLFRQGTIISSRFSPDGEMIVYTAAFDGQPPELYSVRRDYPNSQPVGIKGAHLLAV